MLRNGWHDVGVVARQLRTRHWNVELRWSVALHADAEGEEDEVLVGLVGEFVVLVGGQREAGAGEVDGGGAVDLDGEGAFED